MNLRIALLMALASLAALMYAAVASASTVSVSPGEYTAVLSYNAAPGEANQVSIDSLPGETGFAVTDNGATLTAGAGCTSVNAHEVTCARPPYRGVHLIRIHLGDMDDSVQLNTASYGRLRVFGGEGADDLTGGQAGLNILNGGPGPDVFGTLPGSYGNFVDYSARTNPVTVTLNDGLANDGEVGEGDLIAGAFSVRGTSGNDTMSSVRVGWHFGETALLGEGGDDRLTVHGADAWLDGGAGDDTLIGLSKTYDDIYMIGGPGSDILRGGPGDDDLDGGPGNDRLFGADGPDWLHGRDGSDLLVGGRDRDDFSGDRGADTLHTRDGIHEMVFGGSGHDRARVDRLDRLFRVEELF